jgi:hypothetical protein
MPFSEKQTVVLYTLTVCLLAMLIVYAGSLPSADARAHRTPAEKPSDSAYEESSEREVRSVETVAVRAAVVAHDAGLSAARTEPAEHDDLITILLRQCVSTHSCPAWEPSRPVTSPDAGSR